MKEKKLIFIDLKRRREGTSLMQIRLDGVEYISLAVCEAFCHYMQFATLKIREK